MYLISGHIAETLRLYPVVYVHSFLGNSRRFLYDVTFVDRSTRGMCLQSVGPQIIPVTYLLSFFLATPRVRVLGLLPTVGNLTTYRRVSSEHRFLALSIVILKFLFSVYRSPSG